MLAIQGTTDALGRTMLWSPIAPGADVPFAALLEEALGVPATLENDCNMIALALRWKRPERYGDDFIAILLSHGIGMGMVLKGELFTGTHSSGGEFGHMVVMAGRCALPLRPARLHRSLCRQLCDLAAGHLLADDVMPTAEIGDGGDDRPCRAGPRRRRSGAPTPSRGRARRSASAWAACLR